MPILNVEVVGDPSAYAADLATRLANATARVFQSRPQGTWIKVYFLPEAQYAENEGDAKPVLVSITQGTLPAGEELRRQLADLTQTIADVTGHAAENVHVILEPEARGRIAFGGQLLE
jgi:phenylpyruvate tautomerase PptA (4-oxalocrotonate tautomerase family)